MGARKRSRAAALIAVVVMVLQGCYGYSYHRRSPVRPHDRIAIDQTSPQKTTRWSYWWGLQKNEWTPLPQACQNKGAGKVNVEMAWYSVPVMLLSLGIATPTTVTLYCTTEQAPGRGP